MAGLFWLVIILTKGGRNMYLGEFTEMQNAAKTKVEFMKKNPFGYFIASILAGFYIGFGILLIFTIGGLLSGAPYTKVIMGMSFGVALSLVVIAGAELFTGNNMIMAAGTFTKTIRWSDALRLWIICWFGNLMGSIILAVMFWGAGLAKGSIGEFIATTSEMKMNIPFIPLFLRGLLCNIMVCLGVWCSFKSKSVSGKLIMIFWCLFVFITCGFEHSIANMTLLTISLLAPFGTEVGIGGYIYNLVVVTIGNMAGGILFVALPYYIISSRDKD